MMTILLLLMLILYVQVVLGKYVYDSKRPGKDLTPLKISPQQPLKLVRYILSNK